MRNSRSAPGSKSRSAWTAVESFRAVAACCVKAARAHFTHTCLVLSVGVVGATACGGPWLAAQGLPNNVEATSAALARPAGLAYDAAGNLYIAALADHVVRKIDLDGILTTVAGTGEQGFGGDGGPATAALLDSPSDVALDSAGNLYIADSHNQRIRKVVKGVMTTIAGTGTVGFGGDGGPATAALLNLPIAVSVDAGGDVYIADSNNHRIRRITGTAISTVAGNGEQIFSGDNGPALSAGLDTPNGVSPDPLVAGAFYISDTHNQRIRRVDESGVITTVAGTSAKTFTGDGAAGIATALARPRGIAVNASGVVYVADSDNNRIRTLSVGRIATVSGDGEEGFAGDAGFAVNAALDLPRAVAVGPGGALALSDSNNERIREVEADGRIDTIGGVPPPLTESLLLSGQESVVYGSGSLSAVFANDGKTGTGVLTLLDNLTFTPLSSGSLSQNGATLDVSVLDAGIYDLIATYPGDANNEATASGVFVLTVTPALATATANQIDVLYGQPIPAASGTLAGVHIVDASNVAAIFSSMATDGSSVGDYPITATLSGPASTNYTLALAANSGDVRISQAGSTTTLSTSNPSPTLGAPVILTATVAPQTSGTPTGSVQFFYGATLFQTVALTGSTASATVSSLPLGLDQLTAVYVGDGNFTGSSSPPVVETISTGDFSLVLAKGALAGQIVIAGNPAAYEFTVSPVDRPFDTPIVYSATGLPSGATATFTPAGATLGSNPANFTMTVQTATSSVAVERRRSLRGGAISLALLLLPLGVRAYRRGRRWPPLLSACIAVLGLGSISVITGCGASSGFLRKASQSYTIQVFATATPASGTVLQHSVTVTLTVE